MPVFEDLPFELIKQIARHLAPSLQEDDHCPFSIINLACVGPHFKDAAIEALPHSTSFDDWFGTKFKNFVYKALRDAKFASAIKHCVCIQSDLHTPWVTCPNKIVLENEGVSDESPRKRIDRLPPRLREYLHNCLDDHDALLAIFLLVCKTIESLTLRLDPGNLTCGQVCTHYVWSDHRATHCILSYPYISWEVGLTELTVFSFGYSTWQNMSRYMNSKVKSFNDRVNLKPFVDLLCNMSNLKVGRDH